MTHEVIRAFDAAFSLFDRTVHQVRDDQWTAMTACADWNARDLVNHLVSEHLWAPHLLRKETLAEVGTRYDGDVTGDDPTRAWEEASAASHEAFHAPHALEGEVHVTGGTIPATDYAWQMTTDLAVHAWDLSHATGTKVHLQDSLADPLYEKARAFVSPTGQPGLFDAPVTPPPDADAHARLLTLLGRQP
ncbi:TIGR03086 family metal-binding protein [Streptomyces albiaxialis]|uniref:TIGR03086 family metal-binding protein n=1 Tax=Streptomyces albiaxialis TaxID=329523 RepID=A0ABP5H2T1_9ACTN